MAVSSLVPQSMFCLHRLAVAAQPDGTRTFFFFALVSLHVEDGKKRLDACHDHLSAF